mgnify:CR=1 FL=1
MTPQKAQAALIESIVKEEVEKLPPTRRGHGKFLDDTYQKGVTEAMIKNLFFYRFGIAIFDMVPVFENIVWKLELEQVSFSNLKNKMEQHQDPYGTHKSTSDYLIKRGDEALRDLKMLSAAAKIIFTRAINRFKRSGLSTGFVFYPGDAEKLAGKFTATYQAFARLLAHNQLPPDPDHNLEQIIRIIETAQQEKA